MYVSPVRHFALFSILEFFVRLFWGGGRMGKEASEFSVVQFLVAS
jgi:hypothetical protein